MRRTSNQTKFGVRGARANRGRRRAFSLVEMLVVIAVLAILMAAVWKGGSALISGGKVRDTQGLFATIEQAIEAYRSEFSQSRIANADDVYAGGNPPDDLGVFQGGSPGGSVAAGPRVAMGTSTSSVPNPLPAYSDVRAMILAMRLRSPKARAVLDRIDKRFVKSGREENQFYDPGDGSEAIPLDYYVDAWGTPIEYYSTASASSSSAPRPIASAAFLKANNGEPLLVSYGPNGQEQFSAETVADEGDTSLVADFAGDGVINNQLNQDNIYSSEVFLHRMGGE